MPRRPALITQADVARIIRAAKQAGAASVEIPIGGQIVRVQLDPLTDAAEGRGSGASVAPVARYRDFHL